MKKQIVPSKLLALACAVLLQGAAAYAQDSVVTTSTVTQDGVVQQIMPASSAIMVTSPASTTPVKYTFSKTTTFVDAAGNVVTSESIKQNTPARIYYTKVGDSYVVTKFVVNPTVPTVQTVQTVVPVATPAAVIEETTSTTTTTSEK